MCMLVRVHVYHVKYNGKGDCFKDYTDAIHGYS